MTTPISQSYICDQLKPLHEIITFSIQFTQRTSCRFPAENRDESRLMVINREKKTIEHKMFKDIIDYFGDGDVLVLNNTKVFPARLYGNKEKTGARIEVFLLRELNSEQRLWDVLVDPARKIRIGNKLYFGDDDSLVAEVIDNTTSRGRTLRFLQMVLTMNSETNLQNLVKLQSQNTSTAK